MKNAKPQMVVSVTSNAGSCLTPENWQEVGVEYASCSLAHLLMKPGMDYLNTLPRLADYVVWDKMLVLNGASLQLNAEHVYPVRSYYDGKITSYSMQQLMTTILRLQPHMVLLPRGFYQLDQGLLLELCKQSLVFIPTDEVQFYSFANIHGLYYTDETVENDQPQSRPFKHYWLSENNSLHATNPTAFDFIETDAFARDGLEGKIYTDAALLDLRLVDYADQFIPLEKGCTCPTCERQLTRAYLHHLLENTPLLCQRYFIQHNIFAKIRQFSAS